MIVPVTDRGDAVDPGRPFRLQEFRLESGERIIFVTDGLQERIAAELDVAAALAASAAQHPREVVYSLVTAVMRPRAGSSVTTPPSCVSTGNGGPRRDRTQ